MSEPVPKSIHQVVTNLLTVLAQQGDQRAIAALQNGEVSDVYDDGEDSGDFKLVIQRTDGDYLITDQGATFIPQSEQPLE